MNRRKTDIDMNNLKLYIARDEGKWDEDVQKAGELNLFYDTPQLLFNVKDWTSYWGNARKIAHIPYNSRKDCALIFTSVNLQHGLPKQK